MKMRELFDQLQRDMESCGDSEVIIELKDPTGKIVQAAFLADRVVVKRDGLDQYVLRVGWPSR